MLLLVVTAPAADPPVPVAHRGLAGHAPENTRPAFAACLDLRLGFELDVRRTKDGQLVCVHDETVDRTTDSRGRVADLTLAELRALDAGRWFGPEFTGERVPTLAEVLELARAHSPGPRLIALDLKADDDRMPIDLAKLVNGAGLRDRVVCIGLAIDDPALRKRLKAADPRLPVAVLAQTAADLPAALADPHADWAYVRFVPTAGQVASARAAGKRVFVVGPAVAGREPANWARATAAGADAVLTDFPLELRAAGRP